MEAVVTCGSLAIAHQLFDIAHFCPFRYLTFDPKRTDSQLASGIRSYMTSRVALNSVRNVAILASLFDPLKPAPLTLVEANVPSGTDSRRRTSGTLESAQSGRRDRRSMATISGLCSFSSGGDRTLVRLAPHQAESAAALRTRESNSKPSY